MIYHITERSSWEQAQAAGLYSAPSLASEGFIHCSAIDQILPVANSMFRGGGNLLVLCIDESKLEARVLWEAPVHPNPSAKPSATDDALFPHVYGAIEAAAVKKVVDLAEGDGGFELPAGLQG
ncbi:MAG: DUF952 domain-containing protein [Chloroflexi bacterium]|nr:DUF952 domain-containing protein [Chloroflexota bacterium]